MVEGQTLTTRGPTPSPPFRLLGLPGQAVAMPVPEPQRRPSIESSYGEAEHVDTENPLEPWSDRVDARGTLEWQKFCQEELRARPLIESAYGREIISLLQYPWVQAPSGLAAMVFPPNVGDQRVADIAHYINVLACGAQAQRHTAAGVLAVQNLQALNKFLQKSGISPIVPSPLPQKWSPLLARDVPGFLLTTPPPRPRP